ncbi:cyclic nucleotide-binding domain-containing protein 1 [Lemur catta]|uniref:cyclic nucleotide-binding domain-containing protein 1 n=1 Tax=Lemur catta TaxID=9447 RepID=UPI001E26B8BC|nr:cyclic nucleotide-binding domain-containing protein 1 [Lemur catta]
MPMSSLPAAILSHMIAINNVPPPPLRNIPNLKMSKHIDYGQLKALCHIRGLQRQSIYSDSSAHNIFMKQYPKVFLHKKTRLPKLFKREERRKSTEDKEESPCQQPGDSHNIADHVKKAHGDHTSYGPKKDMENLVEFLAILKKLPVHRTAYEHKTVLKMLKTIPDLTSQLSDEHLKTLSKNLISETWMKGSTVAGNDGFYIILKGVAQPQIKDNKNKFEENESTASFVPQSFNGTIFNEDLRNSILAAMNPSSRGSLLRRWSTFGSLEITPDTEAQVFSVVTLDDCEFLKIPAKEYEKLKLEKAKLENVQKLKLIRKCPYYEEWPTLSIYELTALIKWKKFPPGHVIVESGNIISFVGYINSGYCNIYRGVIGFVRLQPNKVKKCQKFVHMGELKERESFGEISVLLQVPFTCTIITGKEVEMAIIEDKDLLELDPVTQKLMLQTAKPTFGHLTDDQTLKRSLYYNGIIPGIGKWNHYWTSIPRNLKDTLVDY